MKAEIISFHEHIKSSKFVDKFLLEMILKKISFQIIDEIPLILIASPGKKVHGKEVLK